MFRTLLFKIGQFIICCMPRFCAYGVAIFLSDLQYRFSKKDRLAVTSNMRHVLPPEADVKFAAREVFRNFGRYIVEFFLMRKNLTSEMIKQQVEIIGLQKLDQALSLNQGALIVTAHLGNWELGAAILSQCGYPVHALALPHKQRGVNDLYNQQREAKGITVISAHNAVRKCIKILKEGKLLALVGDRDFTERGGKEMDFLDKRAIVPKGPAVLSFKTQTPIIPIFLTRKKRAEYCLTVCDPILPPKKTHDVNEAQAVTEIMKKIISIIEIMIKKYPMQWINFREFWV